MILSQKITSTRTIVDEGAVACSLTVRSSDKALEGRVERLIFDQTKDLPADALKILRESTGGAINFRLVDRHEGATVPAGTFEVLIADRSAGAIANECVDDLLVYLGERLPRKYGTIRENRDGTWMRSMFNISRADESNIDPALAAYKPDDSDDDVDPSINRSLAAYNESRAGATVRPAPRHSIEVNMELDRLTKDLRHGEKIRAAVSRDRNLSMENLQEAVEHVSKVFESV